LGIAQDNQVKLRWALKKRVQIDYDELWANAGGTRHEQDGYWHLPARPERRDETEIKSQKRAMYRRRYAMLDEIAALPPERQEEKFARLDAVRRINQREEKIAIGIIFILAFVILPFLIIRIISFFPLDDKNLWFVFLYGLFSITTVSILGFGIGYLIPMLYSNCLRELNERAENMDERSATYRLNAALAKMRDRV